MNVLGLLGFPPPEKRDVVRFYFAKSLPYGVRVYLALALIFAGFAIQVITLNVLFGLPLLIAGVAIILVKGYDSRAPLKKFNHDPSWKTVPIEKITELRTLRESTRKWDRDALDISNAMGCFILLFFLILAFMASLLIGVMADSPDVVVILMADSMVILLPLWFTGKRYILKQPNLAIKVDLVFKLHEVFTSIRRKEEFFKPAIQLARRSEEKTIPTDVRFNIGFPTQPEEFYGLQSQINLNIVQGRSYPYFYCVLAAKPGFNLKRFKKKVVLDKNVICEYQQDENAEVLVIRQYTTKKSGYHTKDKDCIRIMKVAVGAGRLVLQAAE